MRVLVAGWFSFEQMGASAGDLLCRDILCQWLHAHSIHYEVALATPFEGGVDWRALNAAEFDLVVFVCGPFGNGPPVDQMLQKFSACDWVGLNLSMMQDLSEWNPFDLLIERDSSVTTRPDMSFLSDSSTVPVVGTILIDHQPEYGSRDLHKHADCEIARFLHSRNVASIRIDTRLDSNDSQCKNAAQVESLIASVDVVITTRLHGLVLSIRNGIPAVAIDTVKGGAKLTRQANVLGWQQILPVEELSQTNLSKVFDFCASETARIEARECRKRARGTLAGMKRQLMQYFEGKR